MTGEGLAGRGDLSSLWLTTLQDVVGRAAHEVKDALNGVSLNLEVIRSRTGRPETAASALSSFATAAADQFDLLAIRTEALLFLLRSHQPASGQADVGLTLRHLGNLLVPATKSDGGRLEVTGAEHSVPTSAPAAAVRLSLASGLMAVTRAGGVSRCGLERGAETVVRFSHESAGSCTLDPAIAAALAEHNIRTQRSNGDLVIVFPGS